MRIDFSLQSHREKSKLIQYALLFGANCGIVRLQVEMYSLEVVSLFTGILSSANSSSDFRFEVSLELSTCPAVIVITGSIFLSLLNDTPR
jgi:hypothetical protein